MIVLEIWKGGSKEVFWRVCCNSWFGFVEFCVDYWRPNTRQVCRSSCYNRLELLDVNLDGQQRCMELSILGLLCFPEGLGLLGCLEISARYVFSAFMGINSDFTSPGQAPQV